MYFLFVCRKKMKECCRGDLKAFSNVIHLGTKKNSIELLTRGTMSRPLGLLYLTSEQCAFPI